MEGLAPEPLSIERAEAPATPTTAFPQRHLLDRRTHRPKNVKPGRRRVEAGFRVGRKRAAQQEDGWKLIVRCAAFVE